MTSLDIQEITPPGRGAAHGAYDIVESFPLDADAVPGPGLWRRSEV